MLFVSLICGIELVKLRQMTLIFSYLLSPFFKAHHNNLSMKIQLSVMRYWLRSLKAFETISFPCRDVRIKWNNLYKRTMKVNKCWGRGLTRAFLLLLSLLFYCKFFRIVF